MVFFSEKSRIRNVNALRKPKKTSLAFCRIVAIALFPSFLIFGLYVSYSKINLQLQLVSESELELRVAQPQPTESREHSLRKSVNGLPILNHDGSHRKVGAGRSIPPTNRVSPHPRLHLSTSGHSHSIPNNIIFTHHIDLLGTENVIGEDIALRKNVQNNIALHPESELYFFTDKDCLQYIARVMGPETRLKEFFMAETKGMYKADICRGAALYELGGLYMDVDLQARMKLWDTILPNTTFVVPLVHQASKYPGNFFQAFIGSTPHNPILFRYLELFIEYYEGRIDLEGPLGVLLLRRAHDEIIGTHDKPKSHSQSLQYFQEVKYNSGLFPDVPPPTWGSRRACRFVVVANNRMPFIVPFYSRVKGSRMCGGADSEPNH